MTNEDAKRFRYYWPHWVVLAAVLTLLDATGHMASFTGSAIPSLFMVVRMVSATFSIYVAASALIFGLLWLFVVKLFAKRPRTALRLVIIFSILYAGLVLAMDTLMGDLLEEFWYLLPPIIAGLIIPTAIVTGVIVFFTRRRDFVTTPCFHRLRFRQSAGIFLFIGLLPLPFALAPALRHPPSFAAQRQPHPIKHVLLITIDTLRQDALTPYSAEHGQTKQIDRLAQSGFTFTHAISAAPWTMPAVASIMSGVPPSVHQAVEWSSAVPERIHTLAEYFSDAGYHTAAVGENFFLSPHTHMDQGFQEYEWYPKPLVTARTFNVGLAHWLYSAPLYLSGGTPRLADSAIAWLEANHDKDFFLWVHFFDPHVPYTPPKEFYPNPVPDRPARFWDIEHVRSGRRGRTREERAWIRGLYEAEVRYVDANVGRILDTLDRLDLYDDTLILLTSDHGEELWDHGGMEHGHSLYNELIQVPLLVKPPHATPPRRVDTYVSTMALLPTLLDLCGIPAVDADALRPSLAPLLQNAPAQFPALPIPSGALLYYDQQESVIFDHMKYIRSKVSDFEALFDLDKDPAEKNSLVYVDETNRQRGRDLLDGTATAPAAESPGATEQDKQILQSLGYL